MMLYPDYNCLTCTTKQKANRGCEQDAPIPYWSDLSGNQHTRCPRRPVLENPSLFNTFISAYNTYKNGYLPHAGGINDQHCNFPIIMQYIDNFISKCEEAKRKQEADKKTVTY